MTKWYDAEPAGCEAQRPPVDAQTKPIDWGKPLRTVPSGYPATTHVLPTGERVIRWIDPNAPYKPAGVAYVLNDGTLQIGMDIGDGRSVIPRLTRVVENSTVTKFRVAGSRGSLAVGPIDCEHKGDAVETARRWLAHSYADSVSVRPVEVPA